MYYIERGCQWSCGVVAQKCLSPFNQLVGWAPNSAECFFKGLRWLQFIIIVILLGHLGAPATRLMPSITLHMNLNMIKCWPSLFKPTNYNIWITWISLSPYDSSPVRIIRQAFPKIYLRIMNVDFPVNQSFNIVINFS